MPDNPQCPDDPATAAGDLDDIGAADVEDPAEDVPTTERVEQDRPDTPDEAA